MATEAVRGLDLAMLLPGIRDLLARPCPDPEGWTALGRILERYAPKWGPTEDFEGNPLEQRRYVVKDPCPSMFAATLARGDYAKFRLLRQAARDYLLLHEGHICEKGLGPLAGGEP
jgi:hypothetical protein